jgi:hypothetical protein
MVKTTLVESDLIEGRRLLNELRVAPKRTLFRVRAGFWFYYPESEEWRLVIGTPLVDEEGPLAAYKQLQPVLQELIDISAIRSDGLSLQNIEVISPRRPLVKAIKALASRPKISPGLPDVLRLSGNSPGGMYIQDAYVYTLQR